MATLLYSHAPRSARWLPTAIALIGSLATVAVGGCSYPRSAMVVRAEHGPRQSVGAHSSNGRAVAFRFEMPRVWLAARQAIVRRDLRGQLSGNFTIQQLSTRRFVDAHETANRDYGLVTRPAQNNDSQRWSLKPLGNDTYTIQQLSTGRFVDAHETANRDFGLVTRPAQNDDSQRWLLKPLGNDTYTIQQLNTGRFVDAHETARQDYRLVTRPAQNNDSQRWLIRAR